MRIHHAAGGLMMALALAGCQRTGSMDSVNTQPNIAPLQAQPIGSVSSSQLPDPTTSTSGGQFPEKPGTDTAMATGTGVGTGDTAAASALDVKKEGMVGNWRVSNGPSSCDMFLTLTNLGGGSRGGTRGCAGELTTMGSWEVAGKQVVLKDRNGNAIARLYKTADSRFDGSTNSGQPVSLSR
ncbi:protease inhibitor Inh/omp19 family protein [Shinella sp. PSBB067]|uniref:protease inhibitor Inh/omp19 family protein n=1 Tax=Shinella sp. PSBB067 TaxID=2715959 RepID=UPI00193B97ED|nr:protease inhibitor Inh/omp19 family protein [Shinella sp. PSBB067]QRI62797.1 protease inhibitor Inh/omp19 family protein [Shinella sp. PSBB067]